MGLDKNSRIVELVVKKFAELNINHFPPLALFVLNLETKEVLRTDRGDKAMVAGLSVKLRFLVFPALLLESRPCELHPLVSLTLQ